jgi:hypothetical protein
MAAEEIVWIPISGYIILAPVCGGLGTYSASERRYCVCEFKVAGSDMTLRSESSLFHGHVTIKALCFTRSFEL